MPPIRVAVVDESVLVRGLLAEAINRQPDMVCVGSARDPLAARELLREGADVLTLDAGMTRIDALELLSRLMRLRTVPVVLVVPAGERGDEIECKARGMGVRGIVRRPASRGTDGTRLLVGEIVRTLREVSAGITAPTAAAPLRRWQPVARPAARVPAVAAG